MIVLIILMECCYQMYSLNVVKYPFQEVSNISLHTGMTFPRTADPPANDSDHSPAFFKADHT